MKKSELRQIIREEISKVLKESNFEDIPADHPLKKEVELLFDPSWKEGEETLLKPYHFKYDKVNKLIGIEVDYVSNDIRPRRYINDVVKMIRGMIRKNSDKYSEIKTGKDGYWSEKDEVKYPSLEDLDPDYYVVVKLK